MSQQNMMQVARKDYSYAKTLLDKLNAIVADLGWHATRRLAEAELPEQERILYNGTDAYSGQEELKNVLWQRSMNEILRNWLLETGNRIDKFIRPVDGEKIATFEALLDKVEQTCLAHEAPGISHHQHLCIEATRILAILQSKLYEEDRTAHTALEEAQDKVSIAEKLRGFSTA